MPYTLKPSKRPDEYDLFDGSNSVATVMPISNGELFLNVVGGGKWFTDMPQDFLTLLVQGSAPEEYVARLLKNATPACSCDGCLPQKSENCKYKKSEDN